MNAKERRIYWRKVEAMRKTIEDKFLPKVDEIIKKEFNQIAYDLQHIGVQSTLAKMSLKGWDKEMLNFFNSLYREAVVLFGNASYRAIKTDVKKSGSFGFNEQWIRDVVTFLANDGFWLVSAITNTTRDKLIQIITKGVNDGLGVEAIVKLVLADENLTYTLMRARRIVRTETMRASNIGAMKGAEAHGFLVDKVWISRIDTRTRHFPQDEFDHYEMDGKQVPLEQPFTSTGKKGEPVIAMQPGDPSAPAGFTINCRCTVGFIARRDAQGRLMLKP